MCPRVSIFIGVLQQVENLENELRASYPSETQPFRGSEIPREKPRLMKREPRQQLPVDHRPIRVEAAVGHAVAVEILGAVHRKGETRARGPRRSQGNAARQRHDKVGLEFVPLIELVDAVIGGRIEWIRRSKKGFGVTFGRAIARALRQGVVGVELPVVVQRLSKGDKKGVIATVTEAGECVRLCNGRVWSSGGQNVHAASELIELGRRRKVAIPQCRAIPTDTKVLRIAEHVASLDRHADDETPGDRGAHLKDTWISKVGIHVLNGRRAK